ncbi:hypothetical protein Tco_1221149 [Tanacetum coccineum]
MSTSCRSTKTSNGLVAIQAQLNNLGKEIKKVNEKVYTAQVGCELCKVHHYTKDCPLKEEGKTLEEAYYTQFGVPFQQGGQYRAVAPGFYHRNNGNPSYQEKRETMEESLRKFMAEFEKSMKKTQLLRNPSFCMDAANQKFKELTIKALEIKTNECSRVIYDKCKDAHNRTTLLDDTLPPKEKDPRSFTLALKNLCFNKALADLGASVSVMPFLTYTNLGIGELAPTKLIIELADRTVKCPKENRVTRTKKCAKLSVSEKIQADCDLKATNIILQGLPSDIYSLINHYRVAKDLWEGIQLLMQGRITSSVLLEIYSANQWHEHLQDEFGAILSQYQHELHANELHELHANEVPKAVLMANLSSYGSDVLSEYLHETQNAAVQDTNSSAQQDAMILSVFEQLSNQVTNCNKVNNDNLIANESLSAELERYKERVKLLEERQNIDLRMEAKNIDKEIALEKKVKELDNIVCKMGQSAQTVHMFTKPQVFYDSNLKQALGFQNPFYLKQAQQIRPMLYDGSIIAKETNMISIADSEETLMLEEESRSKMLLKNDPKVLEKKINIKPIIYAELNRLSEDFCKRFVPQQELSDEHAFRLQTSHPNTDQSASLPVVKERTTPTAITEGTWDFEHTKAFFVNEIIPFLNTLKDTFNNFNQCLLDEINEVQTVFNQMEKAVEQCRFETKSSEIQKKQVLNENDRLLDQIISQDIVNIVVNSSVDMNTSVNVNSSVAMNDSVNYVEKCNKCLELEAELIKQHDMIQAKDTTIEKLKANIKRLNKTSTTNNVKKDIDEIETINIELEHRVAKLIAKNEHLKQTYKQLYDSIKPSRVRAKEHTKSLVNQLNQKSVEITDLNAQLQEKVFVITAVKNDLRKLKGKDIVDNDAQVSNATTIAPEMYKLDLVTLAPKDKNNRIFLNGLK